MDHKAAIFTYSSAPNGVDYICMAPRCLDWNDLSKQSPQISFSIFLLFSRKDERRAHKANLILHYHTSNEYFELSRRTSNKVISYKGIQIP